MANARKTDPTTSHQAAASVDNVNETQSWVLKALNHPRTDVDLVEAYRHFKNAPRASESGIRTRRAELVSRGLVKDSGIRATLPSGRKAIVWERVG